MWGSLHREKMFVAVLFVIGALAQARNPSLQSEKGLYVGTDTFRLAPPRGPMPEKCPPGSPLGNISIQAYLPLSFDALPANATGALQTAVLLAGQVVSESNDVLPGRTLDVVLIDTKASASEALFKVREGDQSLLNIQSLHTSSESRSESSEGSNFLCADRQGSQVSNLPPLRVQFLANRRRRSTPSRPPSEATIPPRAPSWASSAPSSKNRPPRSSTLQLPSSCRKSSSRSAPAA